jgi:hypothetical protein
LWDGPRSASRVDSCGRIGPNFTSNPASPISEKAVRTSAAGIPPVRAQVRGPMQLTHDFLVRLVNKLNKDEYGEVDRQVTSFRWSSRQALQVTARDRIRSTRWLARDRNAAAAIRSQCRKDQARRKAHQTEITTQPHTTRCAEQICRALKAAPELLFPTKPEGVNPERGAA